MRIKINLKAENNVSIPIEYNYNIYQNIKESLFQYLETHKPKLMNKFKKHLPSFTFSQLMVPERIIEPGFIEVKGNFLALLVSSTDETFMEYLVKAVNHQKEFRIFNHTFPLKKLEVMEEPEFSEGMRFKMLSPLVLMVAGNKNVRFLRPEDGDLNNVFAAQLVNNYNEHHDSHYQTGDITFTPDQNYIERKRSLTKSISVKGVIYKAIFVPFALTGEIDLIRFAYHNGIGFNTHYGFGMIETVG